MVRYNQITEVARKRSMKSSKKMKAIYIDIET